MVEAKDLLNIVYYHYGQPFFGSDRGIRYRLAREPLKDVHMLSEDEKKNAKLKLSIWKEPFSYEKTNAEEIEELFFAYSEEGLKEACAYLNRVRK
ncbi:MAG: hypothetical protein Q4A19_00760 [Johnsonella sp.]|nr:hypothetical protein [Johnsonella sp.]